MPIYLSVTRKLLTESDTYLSDPRVKEKPANEDEEMVTDFKVRKAVEKLADAGRVSVAEIALEKQVHLHSGSAFMQFSRLLLDQYEESPDEYEAINYGQTCMIV
jgi:hypothetical protein